MFDKSTKYVVNIIYLCGINPISIRIFSAINNQVKFKDVISLCFYKCTSTQNVKFF